MFSFILSAAAALTLCSSGIQSLSSPKDTSEVYIINNTQVNNFDGSQLVGKTIKTYETSVVSNKGKTIRTHVIVTDNSKTFKISGTNHGVASPQKTDVSSQTLYLLNDKVISKEEFSKIQASEIKSVDVIKHRDLIKTITDDDNIAAVIKIKTK